MVVVHCGQRLVVFRRIKVIAQDNCKKNACRTVVCGYDVVELQLSSHPMPPPPPPMPPLVAPRRRTGRTSDANTVNIRIERTCRTTASNSLPASFGSSSAFFVAVVPFDDDASRYATCHSAWEASIRKHRNAWSSLLNKHPEELWRQKKGQSLIKRATGTVMF